MPGGTGAAFDANNVMAAIVTGRKRLPFEAGVNYLAFVVTSGGSSDDAVLGIAHFDNGRKKVVLDVLESQTGKAPFSPRAAVKKFAGILQEYGLTTVTGDAYAGQSSAKISASWGLPTSSARCRSPIFTTRSSRN